MIYLLRRWVEANQVILANAASLIGTTAVTSSFGFFFWWFAARLFPPAAVGLASAAISAMMLLGTVGMLGLGTLLIGELHRQPDKTGPLITTAMLVAGMAAGGLGILFAVVAPHLSTEFEPLAQGFESVTLFVSGVVLSAITLVLDQALIGLLSGRLQLWRNTFFAAAKLIALLIAGIWFAERHGLTIYTTWIVGNLVSLVAVAGIILLKGIRIIYRPLWGLLRELGRSALEHHTLNIALIAPGKALPVLVTGLLSAKLNASFYIAWMIASFAFVAPGALTTVLYAVGAADPTSLPDKIRLTLKLSLLAGLLTSSILLVSSTQVLSLFGTAYAEQAAWILPILALGVFPLIVKDHYVAICRVHSRILVAAMLMIAGGIFELIMAVIGASISGLLGLSLGWVAALCVEAALMASMVYKTATSVGSPRLEPG